MNNKFLDLFPVQKPIIGMIHLAGNSLNEKIYRAVEELELYQQEDLDGAIIEDYHSNGTELIQVLPILARNPWYLKLGINFLRSPEDAFDLASQYDFNFVQVDTVEGINDVYLNKRLEFPQISLLGGVRFKYQPSSGKTLEDDILRGTQRCDAIVTTGSGTGKETPLEKLKDFKSLLPNFPLVVGAGVTLSNICDQLNFVDCAIIGSYFKPNGNTQLPVEREKVRDLMSVVKEYRLKI